MRPQFVILVFELVIFTGKHEVSRMILFGLDKSNELFIYVSGKSEFSKGERV